MELTIATGMSARSKTWQNKKISWSELVSRLKKAAVTTETYKEFITANRQDQVKIKDVGGFVGGYLRNGRRKPENVVNRQLLTLDVDFATKDFWDDFVLEYGCAAVLHSTHKHCDKSPRLRLIIPLSREVTPDEYVAIARQVAGTLGIDLFDNTTFEVNRLMFWPSVSRDSVYYFREQEGEVLDADAVLDSYTDWHDTSLWPTADKRMNEVRDAAKKQEDPELKKGIVGAFCRTYSIEKAIDTYLPDIYSPCDIENRYTYLKGSTTAGLIVYDGKFAYSHHGTDPCGGKLCNAFDLVRIHLFSYMDADDEAGSRGPSFKAMEEKARADKKVKKIIAKETIESAKYEFSEPIEPEADSTDWMEELEVDAKGNYLSSATNLNIIFANDARLKKVFRENSFDNRKYVYSSVPWRRVKTPEPWKNVDLSGLRNYIETMYGITAAMKVEDSLTIEFDRNKYNPVLDYLNALIWDGMPRVDTLLSDYLGAADDAYTREAMRKTLVAAVARIYEPGAKFDTVLTLVGEQGTGKSTFVKKLGGLWYSDSFVTVQGKEAFEQLQGAWIIEIAELAGLKKAEVEAIKHFISKQEDIFRPAYGHVSETYKRQCVFIGTTNRSEFLRDPSGNRRFWPVDINPRAAKSNVWDELTKEEVAQIWAEAVEIYKKGEKLYLSEEAESIAFTERKEHTESDERKGLIEQYLNTLLPHDWEDRDLYARRTFLNDELSAEGTVERDEICIAEIWCELFCNKREDMDRYKTHELNDIMRSLDDWEAAKSTKNFKLYGKQKYYRRSLL